MIERTLPHNIEAEKSILGAVLLHDEALLVVIDLVQPEDFFRDAHQRIYRSMLALSETGVGIDLVTLKNELDRRADLDEAGGPAYISALVDGLPRSVNVKYYAAIVAEKSRLRQAIFSANKLVSQAYEASEDSVVVLSEAAESLFSIGNPAAQGRPVAIGDLTAEGMEAVERAHATKGNPIGLSTGFTDLDEILAGLQPSDLVLLAARTSVGKTAFALNVARKVAGVGKHVFVSSMEMSKQQLYLRMLAAEARVDSHRMRSGILGERDWAHLSEAMGALAELPLYIDDSSSLSPLQLRARARMVLGERQGLDLIVVDYLQLMHGHGRYENRTQEIGTVSRGLKSLAKEMGVPVLALCQLSRSADTMKRRPQLSDLRESGDLEQDADVVLFIYRPDMHDTEDAGVQGIAEVIVAKQRNGPTGVVKLAFIREYTRFENLATQGG